LIYLPDKVNLLSSRNPNKKILGKSNKSFKVLLSPISRNLEPIIPVEPIKQDSHVPLSYFKKNFDPSHHKTIQPRPLLNVSSGISIFDEGSGTTDRTISASFSLRGSGANLKTLDVSNSQRET